MEFGRPETFIFRALLWFYHCSINRLFQVKSNSVILIRHLVNLVFTLAMTNRVMSPPICKSCWLPNQHLGNFSFCCPMKLLKQISSFSCFPYSLMPIFSFPYYEAAMVFTTFLFSPVFF